MSTLATTKAAEKPESREQKNREKFVAAMSKRPARPKSAEQRKRFNLRGA